MNKNQINIPQIKINAEHQRQLWLNFSPSILVGIIILYLCVIYLGFNANNKANSENSFSHFLFVFGNIAYVISNLFLIQLIRRSIKSDIDSKVWDQLRMSALSAWQMTWTRIFTAPLLAWISILISICLISIGINNVDLFGYSFSALLIWIIYLSFSISIACIFLLNQLQFTRSNQEWNGSTIQVVLLFIIIYQLLLYTLSLFPEELLQRNTPNSSNIIWTILLSSIVMVTFLGLGLWKSMENKLYLKSSNAYWLIAQILLPILMWICLLPLQFNAALLLYLMISYYSISILISVSTQSHEFANLKLNLQKSNLKHTQNIFQSHPSWFFLVPMTIVLFIAYIILNPEMATKASVLGLYIIAFIAINFCSIQMSRRYNAVTMALVWFIILYYLSTIFSVFI